MKPNVKKRVQSEGSKDGPGKIRTRLPLYWIGLLCFSSVWMFVLGVLVGRGQLPVTFDTRPLQKELSALSDRLQVKEQKDLEQYTDNLDNKEELDFYEELKAPEPGKGTEEETAVESQIPPEAVPMKKSLAKATKAQRLPAPEEPQEVATDPASVDPEEETEQSEPVETPQEEETSEETPQDLSFHWTVQISSVKDPAAAERMVNQLKSQGYSAFWVKVETPGVGTFYRVRVGPYKDKGLADSQMTELKQKGYDAFLISM